MMSFSRLGTYKAVIRKSDKRYLVNINLFEAQLNKYCNRIQNKYNIFCIRIINDRTTAYLVKQD